MTPQTDPYFDSVTAEGPIDGTINLAVITVPDAWGHLDVLPVFHLIDMQSAPVYVFAGLKEWKLDVSRSLVSPPLPLPESPCPESPLF